MAEPSEGVYIILNVNSKLAIDVKGGSDASGTNVQQWTKNNGDSQMWAFDKQSDGWQIICSLTGKSLDVASAANNQNVRQWNDTNSTNQRWVVETDGGNFTYNNVSYPTYLIKAKGNTSLVVDVASASTSTGGNIQIHTANSSNAQRWILIPAGALTNGGVYTLVLASDTSMCVDIASASTANKANAQVYSRNGSNAQKFFADVDSQTFITTFRNVNSGKVLDISGGTAKNGANVWQYNSNNSVAQHWLPVKSGSVKIDGETVPTYIIRAQSGSGFVMDCKGGGKTAKTNIQVYTGNGSIAQKFAFYKTDVEDSKLSAPSAFTPTKFSRTGPGSVTVTGLTFSGGLVHRHYQARYFIRYYTAGKASYTDTKWKSLKDDSTSNSGWGDSWNYNAIGDIPDTFDNKLPLVLSIRDSNNNIVPWSKTINLNATDHRLAEIYIQYRLFLDAGVGSSGKDYPTHSPYRQVKITVTQKPVISLGSFKFVENSNKTNFGVAVTLSDSLSGNCEILRGRIIGEDGDPITEWKSSNTMTLSFFSSGSLRRLPEDGEHCQIEYQLLTDDFASISSTLQADFNGYGSTGRLLYPEIDDSVDTGDSCSIVVVGRKNVDTDRGYCLMEVSDSDGTTLRTCYPIIEDAPEDLTRIAWECLPPLNKDVKLIIMGTSDGAGWIKAEITCNVKTHNFIWNWASKTSYDYYDNYAIVIINTDAPPSQTRSYTNDSQFNNPMGRMFPVSFASAAMAADLSVSGVIVDPDASYQASEPLPDKATKEDILKLVRLNEKGIHPVYRTPYGDWNIVAVESVDVSKTELMLSSVDVKQRAVDE